MSFLLIPLTGKEYKMKEHSNKFSIPFFLQTSLSLSYLLHNSMFIGLFGKVLKCKNKINKKTEEIKNRKIRRGVLSFTLSFFIDSEWRQKLSSKNLPEVKWSRKCVNPTLANMCKQSIQSWVEILQIAWSAFKKRKTDN